MNNFFRTIIAGYGAKKLGGGCFSTILIFVLIYWALGTCNGNRSSQPAPQQQEQHSQLIKDSIAAKNAITYKYCCICKIDSRPKFERLFFIEKNQE